MPGNFRSPVEFMPGDLLGFSGHAWSSAGINIATYGIPLWSLSHVAIVGEHEKKTVLFESLTDSPQPCLVAGKLVVGTQVHEIQRTIDEYHGKVWHYPLFRKLYDFERGRLNNFLHEYLGHGYDQIGAFRAGGLGFSWVESWLHPQCLSSLFCSEYCCAAHSTIGVFATDNVARWSPNRLVRKERRMGILLKPRRLK